MCVRVCLRSSLEEEQERAKKELNLGVPEATDEVVAELRRLKIEKEQ